MIWTRDAGWEARMGGLRAGAGTDVKAYTTASGLGAIVSRHPFLNDADVRWHVSVSGPGRLATWPELADAAHRLRPGVPFCMGIPPETWWMNVHEFTLHMWETRDEGLIAEWRRNARGHARS